MIYKDINTSGVMTLKLFGNELSATSLGLVVMFMGSVVLLCTITWRVSEETSRIIPSNPSNTFKPDAPESNKNDIIVVGKTEGMSEGMMLELSKMKTGQGESGLFSRIFSRFHR